MKGEQENKVQQNADKTEEANKIEEIKKDSLDENFDSENDSLYDREEQMKLDAIREQEQKLKFQSQIMPLTFIQSEKIKELQESENKTHQKSNTCAKVAILIFEILIETLSITDMFSDLFIIAAFYNSRHTFWLCILV